MEGKEEKVEKRIECPNCGRETTKAEVRAYKRKNFLKFKWNTTEIVFAIIIIMMILLAYSYNVETKASRIWLKSMLTGEEQTCKIQCSSKCSLMYTNTTKAELTNITNLNVSKDLTNVS